MSSNKYSVEACQKFATDNGWKFLSVSYKNLTTQYDWECPNSHICSKSFTAMLKQQLCRECDRKKSVQRPEKNPKFAVRYTLEDCHVHAAKVGITCLSTSYTSNKDPMVWQCKRNHTFQRNFVSIQKSKVICPICERIGDLTIEKCQELAKEKGGRCLSLTIDSKSVKWECIDNHIFDASFKKAEMIWCKTCNSKSCNKGKKYTIEDCHQKAIHNGGKCLSTKYVNCSLKLSWQCGSCFNIWETVFSSIISGSWCPKCNRNGKSTIEDCIEFAKKNNGLCISTEYVNSNSLLLWQCNNNHQFQKSFGDIKSTKNFCTECTISKITIDTCNKLAKKKKGKCLSSEYINSMSYLEWECEFNHIWRATYSSVSAANSWCAICAKNSKLNLDVFKDIAKSYGGKCLSDVYVNLQTKMRFQCKEGHIWDALGQHIRNSKSWCPKCFGSGQLSLEECKSIAKEREGECLETEYVNCSIPMKWRCKNKHEWLQSFSHVKHNSVWCFQCTKLTLEECQEWAKKMGGKCLSTEYIDSTKLMIWQCNEGHIFESPFQYLKYCKTWCNVCSSFRSERCAIETAEKLLKIKFTKSRHQWLGHVSVVCQEHLQLKHDCGCSISRNILELDGYNSEYKIAIEYQGFQHYEFFQPFHRDKLNFYSMIRRDVLKELSCKFNNIKVLYIPYTFNFKDLNKMEKFIHKEIYRLGIDKLVTK